MESYSIVAGRYANALVSLASEKGQLDAVYADMQTLLSLFEESEDLRSFLRNPVIAILKKQAALDALFKGKLSDFTCLFLHNLAHARREGLIGEIAFAYITQYKESKGVLQVKVKSASPLSASGREQIVQLVQSVPAYQAAKSIEIKESVSPDLIGGLIVTVGDRQVDASFSRKIQGLKRIFQENLYVKDF